MSSSSLPSLIQRFFTDRLLVQLGASSCTVAAYRDAFRLFFQCNYDPAASTLNSRVQDRHGDPVGGARATVGTHGLDSPSHLQIT